MPLPQSWHHSHGARPCSNHKADRPYDLAPFPDCFLLIYLTTIHFRLSLLAYLTPLPLAYCILVPTYAFTFTLKTRAMN